MSHFPASRRIHHLLLGLLICGLTQFPAAYADSEPATLQPVNRTQFFLRPGQDSVLQWKMTGNASKFDISVIDYTGQPVSSQSVETKQGELTVPLKLAVGYYELSIQPGNQRFGLVVSEPSQGAPDQFFSIDAGLCWLETRPEVRTDLISILKRSGIGSVRERLSWGAVNPTQGQWNWESDRQVDSLRKEYERQGVPILELFHGSPEWTRIDNSNPYPQRLPATKDAWQVMGKRWQGAWNALEVWNEPDIDFGGDLPADQLLPVIKTINYGLRESGSQALVGGGTFAYFNPGFIRAAVQNGLLDNVDFASFHTYAKAPYMEQIAGDYRRALTIKGKTVPLWLTESGQPWKSGTARPDAAEDALTARDITMKAIEAKACGIARYFAFVYPFYVEGSHNFGMMGQEVSPLRSMAAYVEATKELSGTRYVGDLNIPGATRARIFARGNDARGNDATAVLYTGEGSTVQTLPWIGNVVDVQGIDGRALHRLPDGAIPIPDGLTYVHTSLKTLTGLQRKTMAADLTAAANSARFKRPAASPIVLQPLLPPSAHATKRGYQIAPDALNGFVLKVRVNNLSKRAEKLELRCTANDGSPPLIQHLALEPSKTSEATFAIDLAKTIQNAQDDAVELTIGGHDQDGNAISPLVLDLLSERDLPSLLKLYGASTRLDLTDLTKWDRNITGTGQMTIGLVDGATWQLQSHFTGGDRWVFPNFQLPAETNWSGSAGVVVRARTSTPGTIRFMIKERSGAVYFSSFAIVPDDGKWHAVSLRWADLAALPSAPPDANGHLDLDQVTTIAIGANSKGDESTVEVSDFYLARKTAG